MYENDGKIMLLNESVFQHVIVLRVTKVLLTKVLRVTIPTRIFEKVLINSSSKINVAF